MTLALLAACLFSLVIVPGYLLWADRRLGRRNLSDLEKRAEVRARAHEGISRDQTRPHGNVERRF